MSDISWLWDLRHHRVSEAAYQGLRWITRRGHPKATYYRHLLAIAPDYAAYTEAARHLDLYIDGNEEWKKNATATECDSVLLKVRTRQCKLLQSSGDARDILTFLRNELTRHVGNITNPSLYTRTYNGTKLVVDEYLTNVCLLLDRLAVLAAGDPHMLESFVSLRRSYGRSALLLSGGATLGLKHLGVVKALHDNHALPRIISGTSVGSMIAAVTCCHTDEELTKYMTLASLKEVNALEAKGDVSNFWIKFTRFVNDGVVLRIDVLKDFMRSHIGDITFLEAYKKTRRILNIAVSSETQYEMPKLLNYLTAPDVLVWSAVAASCSIPFIFESSILMCKTFEGNIDPWSATGTKWIDGSVENDLPMARLSEIFGVNHFIVSQVNPHVVPLMGLSPTQLAGRLLTRGLSLIAQEVDLRLRQCIEMNWAPTFFYRCRMILQQRYFGDINIVPEWHISDYVNLMENPTEQIVFDFCSRGERATWAQLSRIKDSLRIEFKIDHCVTECRRTQP